MKILNLYCGIGGNRKLWGDEHEITAVEIVPEIAAVYQDYFPNDKVIIGDAHDYLLKHYQEFDFIWTSPPCQTHSDIRRCGVHKGQYSAVYIDRKLWEEILLLQHFAKCKYVVENVKLYYAPLVQPRFTLGRHCFWANFYVPERKFEDTRKHKRITGKSKVYDFDLSGYNIQNKRQILRNLVNPEMAKYILDTAMNINDLKQKRLFFL